ncbi:S1 RNA-binding domain-containing protein 1 [Nilaparvata lugens]|uniref:S1 RNA-binding domain-containing protein 1 n=1 Tax=Nilaparvata lugens TaxID=108931 RepID=UPI00193E80DE|nr:S1 RNA-binding domain-containing protein 1 [Nilaparvata lugens]
MSDSDNSQSSDDLRVKKTRKRKIESDDDEWIPEEEPAAKKNAKSSKKIKSEDSSTRTRVKKEAQPKVKKETQAKVKKEAQPRVKKETQPKVKKETQPRVKKETRAKVEKELENKIKEEPKVKQELNHSFEEYDEENKQYQFGMSSNHTFKKDDKENAFQSMKGEEQEIKFDGEASSDLFDDKKYLKIKPAWLPEELLSEMMDLNIVISRNIILLFEADNTIPFIARYRKELIDNMAPERLRQAKEAYETIKAIQAKAATILKMIDKAGKMNPVLEQCILGARSFTELEHIYAPYKVGGKKTKADNARKLGLEEAALSVLNGTGYISLESFLNPAVDGLSTVFDVENNISFIIADVISKDKEVLDHLRKLQKDAHIKIECSKSKATKSTEGKAKKEKENKSNSNKHQNKDDTEGKYQNYYSFSQNIKFIKPHQVLAINRGESQKALSVKIVVSDWLSKAMFSFCQRKFMNQGRHYPLRTHFFKKSFDDAYNRLIQPLVVRSVRSELNRVAETAAIEVFATNLKKLLLSPPLKGKTILALDPGFKNGCKAAVTSSTGVILDATVLYFKLFNNSNPSNDQAASKLRDMIIKHQCELIGLGNGTACRETENYLSQLISIGWFKPVDVKYTIVDETGASIYSCSPEAAKEFPDMDPNLISAVSLARRLQEPLCELVKIEPKHLGVGMYQHDVPVKQLSSTLDEVVSECVSFVGVDVNTASHSALRRVAGLNASRATKIIEFRESNCSFTNRQQIRLVKGIGDKSYEQCVGFIRIIPQTATQSMNVKSESNTKKKVGVEKDLNPLDQTWIHPENYSVAKRFITKCNLELENLGTANFIQRIKETVSRFGITSLASEFEISEEQMKLISEGLQVAPDYDFRSNFSQPLFRRGVKSMEDIRVGDVLTGRVKNVTHFGSFVDIGVGSDGLIPASRLRNVSPQLGDRVEVRVISVEVERRRIGLDVLRIL